MAQFPGIYRSPYGNSIAELLMRQGDIAAEGARASGQIWSQAIGQLGQIGAGAVQEYQGRKDQKKREEMFNQALASWDPADPGTFYRGVATAYGPEMATSALRAMSALEASKAKSEPDPKLFQPKAEFIGKLWKASPDWVKQNWEGIAQTLGAEAKALYGVDLTPEWNDAYGKMLDSLGPEVKPIEVSPGSTLVDPSTMKPTYTAPAKPTEPKAPATQNVGGRVMQFNPQSGRFDIDLGASEAALGREAAALARAAALAEKEKETAEKKAEKEKAAAEAAAATDDQVRAAFGAMKRALKNVKAMAGTKAVTSPLAAANARQQYDDAAKAFAATLSRATGDSRISDLDRKAYAALLAYQGIGSGALKIMRPDLVEARLLEAEGFFDAASEERKNRPAGVEDEAPVGVKRGTGTSKDPYVFE